MLVWRADSTKRYMRFSVIYLSSIKYPRVVITEYKFACVFLVYFELYLCWAGRRGTQNPKGTKKPTGSLLNCASSSFTSYTNFTYKLVSVKLFTGCKLLLIPVSLLLVAGQLLIRLGILQDVIICSHVISPF